MLTACQIEQLHLLWDEFKNNMSEDFLNQARQHNNYMSIEFCPEIYNQCLSDLSYRVQDLNSTLTNCGMPQPDVRIELHYEIYQETNYDTYILSQFINEYESQLLDDTREVYHIILNSIENDKGVTFFIDAPGSTCKTFLINQLLAKVRQKKKYCPYSSIK